MNEDKFIKIVVDTQERVGRIEQEMVTKKDHQELLRTLEEVVVIVKANRQEQMRMVAWLQRHDGHLLKHDTEIKKLKMA